MDGLLVREPSSAAPAEAVAIHEDDVNELDEYHKRTEVGRWWVHWVKLHHHAGGTNNAGTLQQSILSDFMAWSLLGSFLASIAFDKVLHEYKPADALKAELNYLLPLIGLTDQRHTETATSALTAFCLSLYMFAAVSSVIGVVHGTFKYLFFAWVPPSMIISTIRTYLEHGFSSRAHKKEIQTSDVLITRWDHMKPILYSTISIAGGTVVGVSLNHGLKIAAPIFFLAIYFSYLIMSAKNELWTAAWKSVTTRPSRVKPHTRSQDVDSVSSPAQSRGRSRSRGAKKGKGK